MNPESFPAPPTPAPEHAVTPEHAFAPDLLEAALPSGWVTPAWAWEGATGRGVRVAILDSGVDAAHPAVRGVSGYCVPVENEGQWTFDLSPHDDTSGHGTACAGIIRSIAPDCEIYSVKVLGVGIWGKAATFLAGLRWALDNGMHVCNLSLGTAKRDYLPALHELADEAAFKGVPLVCAAKNMPGLNYPSLFASVLSVASHAVPDPNLFFCNPHPPMEFSAFGIDVPVAWTKGATITATGNSFAAPHLSAHIVRLLSKHPELTTFQVKTVLSLLAGNASAQEHPSVPP